MLLCNAYFIRGPERYKVTAVAIGLIGLAKHRAMRPFLSQSFNKLQKIQFRYFDVPGACTAQAQASLRAMSDTCMLHARTGTVAFGLLSVGFACAMQGLGEWQLTGARHFLLVHKELRVQAERSGRS